jgi:hypothetical protein
MRNSLCQKIPVAAAAPSAWTVDIRVRAGSVADPLPEPAPHLTCRLIPEVPDRVLRSLTLPEPRPCRQASVEVGLLLMYACGGGLGQ